MLSGHRCTSDLEYGSQIQTSQIRDIISSASSKPVSSYFIRLLMVDVFTDRKIQRFSICGRLLQRCGVFTFVFWSYYKVATFNFRVSVRLVLWDSLIDSSRNFYHFALLHLAILHEQFHNYSEASWVISHLSYLIQSLSVKPLTRLERTKIMQAFCSLSLGFISSQKRLVFLTRYRSPYLEKRVSSISEWRLKRPIYPRSLESWTLWRLRS